VNSLLERGIGCLDAQVFRVHGLFLSERAQNVNRKEFSMERKNLAGIAVASAMLLVGIGAAGASTDTTPAPSQDESAVVESLVSEVSGATVDVIDEAEYTGADDEAGDQQGTSDVSEESDDVAQDTSSDDDQAESTDDDARCEDDESSQDSSDENSQDSSDESSQDSSSDDDVDEDDTCGGSGGTTPPPAAE